MKNLLGIVTILVLMGVTMVVNAQTPDPAVRGAVAGHEVQLANLRIQLAEKQTELGKVKSRASVAKRLGDDAVARDKKIEAKLVAEITRLEALISSETIKARAEVDKEAIAATVQIVGIQHGVTAPAPATDAVAAVTAPTPPAPATGLERIVCLAGTAYRRISVTDGALRTGYREECLPIPGYISPTATTEKSRTMPLWLKYGAFIAGGAVVGGGATYLTNEGGDGNTSGWVTATAAAIGGVAGAGVCAVIELL